MRVSETCTVRRGAWAWSLTPSVMLDERSLFDSWLFCRKGGERKINTQHFFEVGYSFCLGLTRAALGPGTSPFASGVKDSLRFKSSENSSGTGVWGVKIEEGPGRDWAKLSLGSSSVMSSQDYDTKKSMPHHATIT